MSARHAIYHRPAGAWPTGECLGSLTLAWAERHRRRLAMTDDGGSGFLLDLPQAVLLADGDGLGFAEGGWLVVRAAPEAVADIAVVNPADLPRIAWHIGNRHVPLEILSAEALRILDDHVLVAMVEGLGGRVTRRRAPFQAERGAYEQTPHRAFDHDGGAGHDHPHG